MAFREFAKNVRDSVRVTPNRYMGHDLVDIRVYAPAKDDPKATVATRKGISINVDLVPDLIAALKWAVGQPCVEDAVAEEAPQLTLSEADRLGSRASAVLRKHGAPVHWDMAERLILGDTKDEFRQWHLRWVLLTREDLFEHVGGGCFRAK